MSSVALCDPPSTVECHEAVTRALVARIEAYRGSIPNTRMTDAALQERVTGLPLPGPERANDGWWRVGCIVDDIADTTYDVWYQPPVPPRLAVSEQQRPVFVEPEPPVMTGGLEALYRDRWAQDARGAGS